MMSMKVLKSTEKLDYSLQIQQNESWIVASSKKETFKTDYVGALRQLRNTLLRESDWTQFTDSPLTDSKKTEWKTYRQQLRDLPANTSDFANPTWPTKPS